MRNQARLGPALILALGSAAILSASSGAAAPSGSSDLGWPRQYTDGSARLLLEAPQVDSWTDFKKLKMRFAAALTTTRGAHPVWGVLSLESETVVNSELRSVVFGNFRVMAVSYPSAKDEPEAKAWEALTIKLLPANPTTVAIARVLAYLDKSAVKTRQTKVLLDPPPILVSTQPAVLVIIDGEPILVDIVNSSLQKVVNTNWDLFFDKTTSRYYLRDDKVWLSARNLDDAWMPPGKMPKDFAMLPANNEYRDVISTAAAPHKPAFAKLVLVVHKPSELIVLNGQPAYRPIAGTKLMWVSNTECDLFFDPESRQFYFLTSGRWFRTSELVSNHWSAATTSLPEDFRKIPPDHPRAHVLAAVPGTSQAEAAVLEASIPHTATIDRKSAKAEVKYVAEPKFEPIPGTPVEYAANTPNDVLRIGDSYYLCLQGVWFVSASAAGPWEAADKIPDEIYSIPPESSKHNVTYVVVQDSTPETVTYAYTAGYTGVYVDYGVAMWGTGYYYAPYYGYGYYSYPVYWPASYYTYGASAWYNPATGAYGRGSAVYGPYGGYARAAGYNPSTGTYSWGRSAWGSYGAAASGGFYNSNTGGWGGSYHASNGYQSWGQSVVGRDGQWARTASYADSRGAVAGIQTSAGGKAVAARGNQGQGFVGKSAAGDVYAGRDGNVYKRDQASGQWYKNNGGAWESVNRPSPSANPGDRAGQSLAARPVSESSPLAGANRDPVQRDLNRDASARNWGNYNTQKADTSRKAGGWESGGFTGHRTSGWAVRSPGFGRRR